MSSFFTAGRGALTALTVVASAALLFFGLSAGSANAADVTTGSATFNLTSGKAGKVSAISPAKVVKRFGKKGAKVTSKVAGSSFASNPTARIPGGIRFSNGKRKVALTGLSLTVYAKRAVVSGKVAGRKLNLMTASGNATIDSENTWANVSGANLSLTDAAASQVRKSLKLKKAPKGKLGSFSLYVKLTSDPVDPCVEDPDAEGCTLVDPYFDLCGVPAASKVDNAWTDAAAIPTLTGPLATSEPTAIQWGFKSSFRDYVAFAPPAGSLQALDGASKLSPAPNSGFSFPVDAGQYAANLPGDNTDDQAVIDGSGTALFCKSGHGFWLAISDPTIVIDGEDSRIVATVSENLNGGAEPAGPWKTAQRIDLAELDLSGVTPIYNKSGSEVTWSNIPVTSLVTLANNIYPAGTALDPITVAVKTSYDTGAGDAAAWDALATSVQTNHPFPNADPTTGGCEVGVPAGGTATAARTIDENTFYATTPPGPSSFWSASPNPAAAVPTLTGTAVTGGNFNWGFRRSLRASLNATGDFNVAGGASASDAVYYGNGGNNGMRVTPGSLPSGQMGDAGDFFTWPTTSGTYNANGVGDSDDQLVMQTEGVVGFCQVSSAQRYGIIFANPTVVIDGANSRITIDVAVRFRLSWAWATVDFASLNLSDPNTTFNASTNGGTTTVAWNFPDNDPDGAGPLTGDSAVDLTTDGEKMAKMLNAAYVAGLGLDGTVIRATFPAGS